MEITWQCSIHSAFAHPHTRALLLYSGLHYSCKNFPSFALRPCNFTKTASPRFLWTFSQKGKRNAIQVFIKGMKNCQLVLNYDCSPWFRLSCQHWSGKQDLFSGMFRNSFPLPADKTAHRFSCQNDWVALLTWWHLTVAPYEAIWHRFIENHQMAIYVTAFIADF